MSSLTYPVPETPIRLAVIVASVRRGRFGPTVAGWFARQARERPDFDVDVVDFADFAHPREMTPSGDTKEFAETVGLADAFVVVTPEYNHGYPEPLKTAIDAAREEWFAKPVAFVSYGGISGGLRAVEPLRNVFAELHTVTVRNTVSFHNAHRQFTSEGVPKYPEAVNAAAMEQLDQLLWWARALRAARRTEPYPA